MDLHYSERWLQVKHAEAPEAVEECLENGEEEGY